MYAYAANNPVRYIDPDGYSFLGKVLGYGCYVAAGIVVVAGTAVAVTTGGTTTPVLAPAAASFAGKLAITGTVILATDSTYEIAAEARSNAASRKRHKSSASAALPKNGAASAAAGSPTPNNGDGKKHGNDEHNDAIDKKIEQIKKNGGTDIRKNQQQVNAKGELVGRNRPDVQWNDGDGNHHCWEIDHNPTNSAKHRAVITANDPAAIVELQILQ